MEDIKVVGIGRLKITPSNLNKNNIVIPTLHFLVIKGEDGFDSICLELILSSFGKTENEAVNNLVSYTNTYITEMVNMGESGIEQILESVEDSSMEKYWQLYRKINFKLGTRGISTEITDKLRNEIKFLRKRLTELEDLRDLLLLSNKIGMNDKISYEIDEEYEKVGA